MSNFSAISWREQITFNEIDDDTCPRYIGEILDLYSASLLKQQSVERHLTPLWHIIMIPSQSVFALTP